MRNLSHISLIGLAIWAFLSPASAYAERSGKGLRRVLPGGLVFPAFADAMRYNPSALPEEKARVFQATYNPPSAVEPTSHDIGLSIASADRGFGYGLAYRGDWSDEGIATYGMSIGAGVRSDIFSFGLGLNTDDLSTGCAPDISLSLRGRNGKMYYQGMFNKLNTMSQLELGAGITDDKTYTLELNVSLPPWAEIAQGLSVNNYRVTAAVSVFEKHFGASAISSFDTATLEHSHRFNIMFKPTSFMYVITEVAFPQRYRIALTFDF